MFKENSPSQRTEFLKCPMSTINKVINADLNIIKTKIHNVHRLYPRHIIEIRTSCRFLYEEHLSEQKGENVITSGPADQSLTQVLCIT